MSNSLTSSEQKLLQKLHESEHFIEEVTNSIPDIIYVLDLEKRRILFTNKRVIDLLGPENLQLDQIHPQDYQARLDHLAACRLLQKDEVKGIDLRLKAHNGEWQWFRVKDKAFKYASDGSVQQVIGVMRNVHEHKLAENDLRHKEALLQGIMATPQTGIAVYKTIRSLTGDILDYEFVLVSQDFERFHGKENLKGKWVFEEFPEIKTNVYEQWKRVVDEGKEIVEDTPYQKDGVKYWFHLRYSKFSDGFIVQWEDITEKRKAEEKIQEQNDFIKQVTRLTPDIINVFDFNLQRHIYVNRDLDDVLGISIRKVTESDREQLRNIIHPDDRQKSVEFVEKLRNAKDGEVVDYTYRMRHQSGRWLWFYARGIVFQRDREGRVTQYMAIGQDITAQKEAEERISQGQSLLQALCSASRITISILKSVRDNKGKITDFEYVFTNRADQFTRDRELVGCRIAETFPTVRTNGFMERAAEVVETGKMAEWEQFYEDEGITGWFHVRIVKLGDGFITTSEDITQQKKQEEQLKESERLLKWVRESFPYETIKLTREVLPRPPATSQKAPKRKK